MQQFFLHLHADGASWAQRSDVTSLPAQIERGPLDAVPLPADDCEVIVFVPAIDVLLAEANLPAQSRQRLDRTVPYALEEQFVDDIESQHVAVGKQDVDGKVAAAVVARPLMEKWLAQLSEAGIEADIILPESLSLPRHNGSWSALHLPGAVFAVRSGEQTGFACDASNLGELARRHADELGAVPDKISVTDCANEAATTNKEFGTIFPVPVSVEPCNGDALATLISGYVSRQGINLLQGAYRRSPRWQRGGKHWLPAAAMLFIWLMLMFGTSLSDYTKLDTEDEDYRNRIKALYLQTFPDAKRVVNPRVQMQQRLNALRGGASGNKGFLELMNQVGAVLSQVKSLEIINLSYKNRTLDLELLLTDLQRLDELKQDLLAKSGLEVEVQSATVRKDKLESRIRIKGVL